MDPALEAERLGYTSVWAGESYGTDAVTPIAWVLARTERMWLPDFRFLSQNILG